MIAILFFVGIFAAFGYYAWKDRAKLKADEVAAERAAAAAFERWRKPSESTTKVEPKP